MVSAGTAVAVVVAFLMGSGLVYGAYSLGIIGTTTLTTTFTLGKTTTIATETGIPCPTYTYGLNNAVAVEAQFVGTPIGTYGIPVALYNLGSNNISSVEYRVGSQPFARANLSRPALPYELTFLNLPGNLSFSEINNNLQLKVNSALLPAYPLTLGPTCNIILNMLTGGGLASPTNNQSAVLSQILNKISDEAEEKSAKVVQRMADALLKLASAFGKMANQNLADQNTTLCNQTTITEFEMSFKGTNIQVAYLLVCQQYHSAAQGPSATAGNLSDLLMALIELDNTIANDP